ncbi:MAG TPA: hypothetical protein VN258_14305 [Mobilitalea sp.]|nr:hypothetical protein [Mobilitalea sp.]
MNRHYQMRIDILNMLLRFMLTFTILGMVALLYTNSAVYVWKSLILFQASVLSFLISKFTKHIWSYLVLHLVLLTCFILITDDIILRVLYIIYIVCFALTQFVVELNHKIKNTPLAFLVIFIGMYCICRYKYAEELPLTRFFFILALTYGLIYILNRYLINFYIYLKKHEEKANIPLKQMNKSNNIFITGFLMLSLLVMMFFTKLPIGKVFRLLGLLIRNLLRALFSVLTNAPAETEKDKVIPEDQMPQYDMEMDYTVIKTPEILLKILKVILYITFILFVVLLITLIIYGLYRIYKRYYQIRGKGFEEGQVEVISPFEKIDLRFLRGRISKKNLFGMFGRSNNDRIRKQYMKAIQTNTEPEKVLKYYTPTELSQYAVEPEVRKHLTDLYEKARYSNEECSKEDVQSVKKILK